MDLAQKHGHLKTESRNPLESQQPHVDNQSEVNNLLGSFGHPQNDHPDRRSSGAGNMGNLVQKAREMTGRNSGDISDRKNSQSEAGFDGVREQR
ncbi:hypothetical protein P170DRAFT_511260 [Aspergillus steynii IBT 23096]|uniref:Uncharacterized protein n=1 Tax=Aspergillus steynii IBT 23096 TaxID=1392250 RepID=A0A2I2G0T9_9EURO|nr:uncharacterized protein P170DRAFT_511260 [Aspergillus steynii IBT 23096]PLB46505.1 hypothetical protein P170DRAFT_511260 [Aspergillus steynii IBT 23096]